MTTTRARKLTYADYARLPADGKRHEIVAGEHYVNPAPETYHQDLSRRIQFQLYQQIEEKGRGRVYDAPTDLQLDEHTVVQPDLIVVLAARLHIVTPKKIKGVPDLVVEILSESSEAYDRRTKKKAYAAALIAEYWIVDPGEHVVEQYVLRGKSYALLGQEALRVEFQGLAGVRVDLTRVW